MVKFGLVGVLNTAIDFGIFTLLTKVFGMDPVVSHVISYSSAVVNSYFLNRSWTFRRKEKGNTVEFARFAFINLISLGVSTLAMYLLEEQAGLEIYISKVGATACSMVVNFIGSKLIVFRE